MTIISLISVAILHFVELVTKLHDLIRVFSKDLTVWFKSGVRDGPKKYFFSY